MTKEIECAARNIAERAYEIQKLAGQSQQNTENIQKVTMQVNESVKSLAENAQQLLSFIDTQVMDNIGLLETTANDYNEDARGIDSLVTDFSAISEELLASISNITNTLNENFMDCRFASHFVSFHQEKEADGSNTTYTK